MRRSIEKYDDAKLKYSNKRKVVAPAPQLNVVVKQTESPRTKGLLQHPHSTKNNNISSMTNHFFNVKVQANTNN
jgi:hypothetical protein